MSHAQQMIASHTAAPPFGRDARSRCIEACFECAQVCSLCADACLSEPQVEQLTRCIRLNLDCADVCEATGRILSRLSEGSPALIRAQLQACVDACRACAAECEHHGQHMGMRHCQICATACRECEAACSAVLQAA
jgi:hypothetical protein